MGSVDFDNPGKTVKSPMRLAHVVLRTNNFEKMRDFYTTFLGGHVQLENPALCFMAYDDEHHRIALANVPGTANKVETSCGLEVCRALLKFPWGRHCPANHVRDTYIH